MPSTDQEIIPIIIAGTAILLMLGMFIVSFLFFYQRKHNNHIAEKKSLKDQELLKTRIEIQEDTLTHISREIHDNITQVLSFVKLNLGMIEQPDENTKIKLAESRELVSQTINDLRNLSKSMSFEQIAMLGLVKTIGIEAERVNKSGLIIMELQVEGEPFSLGEQHELVLFRIFQEALNNTLKHSGAKQLKISLQYSNELFNLTLEDNGAGFSTLMQDGKSGAGLRNMANRAALIGGVATIESSPGNGCSIKVSLNPLQLQQYNDATPADRSG
jgi:signal transduction histidine kinase